jgi:hypothetical protein
MKRSVVATLLCASLVTGCAGASKRPGMIFGGLIAGAGAVTIASSKGGSCDGDDPGSNVGCGLEAAGGVALGAILVVLGGVIFLASASAPDHTAVTSPPPPPAPAPTAPKTTLHMR